MCSTGRSIELKLGQGRSQDFFSTEAKESSAQRAEVRARTSEVARPRSGVRFLRRGSQRLPHQQLQVWVSAVSYPNDVRNIAPATKRFTRVLSVQSGLSRQFSVVLTVPC